jgi:hypothetical protein
MGLTVDEIKDSLLSPEDHALCAEEAARPISQKDLFKFMRAVDRLLGVERCAGNDEGHLYDDNDLEKALTALERVISDNETLFAVYVLIGQEGLEKSLKKMEKRGATSL